MADLKENVIEWITGDNIIACTLSQKKHITRVMKLAEKYPDQVSYIENPNGTIFAHLPLKALKLNIIVGREGIFGKKIQEEQGEEE